MLIGPDWCSVRTVKLLTVNKFKIDSLEVSFFVRCEIISKCETDSAKKMLLNYFYGWQAFWKAYLIMAVFAFKN